MKLLLLVLVFALIVGCSDASRTQLRVGFNLWPGYETLYLAQQKGLLADNIELVELLSATDTMDAFRHGRIEVAALTLDEALLLVSEGIALKIVLIMDVSNGADAVVARAPIVELAQLKGKRIAYEQTAVGALMLHKTLDAAQLSMADVDAVHMPVNQHFRAFQSREVDAVVTFEPVTTQLVNQHHKVIFDSAQIPGKIVDVLVVRTAQLSHHFDALQTLISAQFAALAFIKSNPETAAQLMSPRLGLQPNELLAALDGIALADMPTNRDLLVGTGTLPPLQVTADQLLAVLLEHNMIAEITDVDDLVDARFVTQ
ncbi:NitT/TauT family transport system substrate-binding protein [Pseudoalteromonas rubra]|uniref:NitT/TauT family transport system substrate-binding protein n=1 Tax=Pseudoalteromonas rubra TaxID=43658 RepID=A0A8T0C2V4_9GAMM|nr:ABC transporter substrate-binding protein [Pseudoalteromonas rubra]KAF7783688.1 NitT/TauT family transport system substrate-binding protein [Pseudoalteromonas rubra]